ncbi:MAG: CoA transferase [Chloroflexi bacterium]|nr:CoA transferase [Chloroflexota bacterium]
MVSTDYREPLPAIPEYEQPAWDGAREQKVMLQRRADCQQLVYPVNSWWERRLSDARVPQGRFLVFADLKDHPQVVANEPMPLAQTPHWGPIYTGGMPWQFSKSPPRPDPARPGPGRADPRGHGQAGHHPRRVGRGVPGPGPQPVQSPDERETGLMHEHELEDVRVLDLTSGQADPSCTMLLGDSGADVVKVEPPSGDATRGMPPFVNGESPIFLALNRD